MSSVLRPSFFEGQVLAASDLAELVDYARARAERHEAHLHRPGIVNGLTLTAEPASDAADNEFKRVFVNPGIAVDGLGRQLVLDTRMELDALRFRQTLGASADKDSVFPVLMRSVFASQTAAGRGLSACDSTQGKRVEERIDVFVGRSGDERALDATEAPPTVRASPAEGAGPPLLLGFVKWSQAAGQFSDIADGAASSGVSRQYVGVNAGTLAGLGNRVLLQLKPSAVAGDLALELDGAAGALRFGPLQGSGSIGEPLFSIDRDGNLQAKGVLNARSTAGTLLVNSGTLSDGMIVPLPTGITEAQIGAGDVTVQVLVSPHINPAHSPFADKYAVASTEECRVDEARRLLCRIAWMKVGTPPEWRSAPGAADFVVLASKRGVSS